MTPAHSPSTLISAASNGDAVALARAFSAIERGGTAATSINSLVDEALRGQANDRVCHVVGLTGAPGAGKSTLTDAFVRVVEQRNPQKRVAALLVDPSSARTGGAILGDRVRMSARDMGSKVFVRSLATRGQQGGLTATVAHGIRLLEAIGFSLVIVETVGVGQVEIDVAAATDTTVVVLNPGWGDAVQASKAGLMEVADVFVVNKADRPGAAETERDVLAMLHMQMDNLFDSAEMDNGVLDATVSRPSQTNDQPTVRLRADERPNPPRWVPPVIRTDALSGAGVPELLDAVEAHRNSQQSSGRFVNRRAARREAELWSAIRRRQQQQHRELSESIAFLSIQRALINHELSLDDAAERALKLLRE